MTIESRELTERADARRLAGSPADVGSPRETPAMPRVHAIVVNYNGWRDTIQCLESIRRLDYPDLEIIVCDNGSTDESYARLMEWAAPIPHLDLTREQAETGGYPHADPRLIFIRNTENAGFTGGNNIGLRFVLAKRPGAYAWLLNNDMVVARDSLRQMVELAERDSALAAVGATIYDFVERDVVQEAGGGRLTGKPAFVRPNDAGAVRGSALGSQRLDYISGACMLLRRSALETIGILDERFFIYAEDVDLCVRLQQGGFTIGYCQGAEVWHKASATTGGRHPFKDYHIVRSVFLFGEKHSPKSRVRSVIHGLYRFVLPKVARAEWNRLAAVVRGYLAYRRDGNDGNNGSPK
jgi:GT2 family glycosyltransferase